MRGIDYSFARPGGKIIQASGYSFVCRYLSYTSGKTLDASERDDLYAHAISIVLVWETTATRALSGFKAGQDDADEAHHQLLDLDFPKSQVVYFAVDFDATEADQVKIDDYLRGAASILGKERVGVYGGFYVVQRCFNNGTATFGWQTYAWSGAQWDTRAQLRQIKNGVSLNGDVDIDESTASNFGQYNPNTTPMENWEKIADDRLKQINEMGDAIKNKDAELDDLKKQLANSPTGTLAELKKVLTDILK